MLAKGCGIECTILYYSKFSFAKRNTSLGYPSNPRLHMRCDDATRLVQCISRKHVENERLQVADATDIGKVRNRSFEWKASAFLPERIGVRADRLKKKVCLSMRRKML